MKRYYLVLRFFVAVLLHAGERPEWVEKNGAQPASYPSDVFLTGFGVSGSKGEEADERNEALAMARRDLISALRVNVTPQFIDQAVEKDKRLSPLAVSLVKTESGEWYG